MKPIPNYPNYAINKDGEVWSLRFNRKLTPCKNSRGYMQIVLCKDLKYKNYTIHRLIAESYIENINNCVMVNHKNGIKHDNRIENLEWVTASQNIQHAFDTGLKTITTKRIVLDTATGVFYNSITEAAKFYNINMKTLYGYLSNTYPNKTTLIYA